MQRRRFLASGLAAGTAAMLASRADGQAAAKPRRRFQLHYAPHYGMFRHSTGADPIEHVKFIADQGFSAIEYNGLRQEPPDVQEKLGRTLDELGIRMGIFIAHGSIGKLTFAVKDEDVWAAVLNDFRESVDVARRVNAKWMTVVPGNADENLRGRLARGYQTANVIELLRRGCEIFEPHGLVMVIEPLNWFTNHGGVFLQGSPQAYAICKAVNSPSCKILFDIYHQQITEGNLIQHIDRCWDEIAYFQAGDNPGRKEPGTGEINYRNVFRHIHAEGYDGIIGMEHGNSLPGLEGEQAVIDAYVKVDQF